MSTSAGLKMKKLIWTKLTGTSDMKKVKDLKGQSASVICAMNWSIRMTVDRNEGLKLSSADHKNISGIKIPGMTGGFQMYISLL